MLCFAAARAAGTVLGEVEEWSAMLGQPRGLLGWQLLAGWVFAVLLLEEELEGVKAKFQ